MPPQGERIAALEEFKSSHSVLFKACVGGVVLWLGSLSALIYGIKGDLQAIKQHVAEGGNKQIVSELKDPKSQAQFKATLSTVVAQVQVARANGTKPNEQKVANLSRAVSQASQRDPELSEVWRAASELVSYRSPAPVKNLGNCNSRPYSDVTPIVTPVENQIVMNVINFHDCTIDLGDVDGFLAGGGGQHYKRAIAAMATATNGQMVTVYTFDRVHIIYHGGPVLPTASQFIFADCTFDFDLTRMPPPEGQKVTQNLLIAGNINDVKIDLKST